jgi:hypothetical protein
MEGKTMQRVLALVVVLAAAGGVIAWRTTRTPRHEATIRFKDAQGLKRGHKVLFKGVPVGEVTEVTLSPQGEVRVGLWLYDEHKALILEGATGRIAQSSLVSVSGEKTVELFNASETGKPLPAGAELVGVEGWMELKAWQAARWGEAMSGNAKTRAAEWYDRATQRMGEMYARARQSLEEEEPDAETKQFLADLKAALDRRMQDFEKEWPELDERYRALHGRLRERRAEAAERLQKAWREFEEGMEKEEARGDAQGGGK